MKRHVEEKELPYFAATLTAYLRESHPELLPDKHFIAERSDHAAQTYERAVRNGNSVYEALELSNAVLYQDLRFSKYDAIFEDIRAKLHAKPGEAVDLDHLERDGLA